MKYLTNIMKGSIVGISFILPGISGSMLATSLGIYENLIEALSNFNKKPIKSILSISDCLIGIVIGILLGILAIQGIFSLFPIPIVALFIGFILGAVPFVLKSIFSGEKKWYNYLIAFITLLVMISIMFIKPNSDKNLNLLTYFLIGLVTAIPLIVPGLSSAMFLMIFGVFNTIINDVSKFVELIMSLKIKDSLSYVPNIFVLVIGVLIGVVVLSKVINILLKEHRLSFNYSVLIILIVSPINIFYSMYNDIEYQSFFENLDYITIIISMVLLAFGFFTAYIIDKKSNSNEEDLDAKIKE